MMDLLPGWLEDPSAYAQPANLDMSTVLLVAGANLVVGVACVTCFEVCRRRWPAMYSPKERLIPGSTPCVMHSGKAGAPLSWVRPLLALSDEEVLRCGGYDVLVYLRFIKLAIRIFGSFAPYAFIVLLPVNASVFYFVPAEERSAAAVPSNTFNRLSLSSMPVKDSRMWAHCLGVYLLTGITMHLLARECRWYMRLRHRFLTERGDARQRTVLVKRLPVELRGAAKLAEYFGRLYPGKVVGAVVCRRVDRLDALVAARDASRARLDRVAERRTRRKLAAALAPEARCLEPYSSALEDLYDPYWWRCEAGLARRELAHQTDLARLEDRIAAERRRQAAVDALVGRPASAAEAASPTKVARATVLVDDVVVAAAVAVDGADDDDVEKQHRAEVGAASIARSEDSMSCSLSRASSFSRGESEELKQEGVAFEECYEDEDLDDGGLALARCRVCCARLHRRGAEAAALLGPRRAERLVGDKAFVTFNAFSAAAVATQVFHAATPGGMYARMAPEPRDVFWPNVHVTSKQRTTRRVVANAVVALLLVFYVVPVTLLSLVLSDQSIKARSPAVRRYAETSLVAAACVKMLQPMALIALMLLLPPFFLGLGFWEGQLSWSANTLAQLSRYYSFQITNVLLVTTVAGSVINCLKTIIDHPKMTFALLGESLPQVCAFFSCYIFIKAFSGLTLELCRGVAAAQQLLKRLVYPSATARDRAADVLGIRDLENPGWFSYGKFGAQDLLVVVLLMTYSVMAPVILVPGMLFLVLAAIVYRHQLLYVYTPIFESGGLLWPPIYRRTLFSLFILHFTMTGIFFLKHAYYQGYCVLALSCLTYLYKVQMRNMYVTSSSVAHHLPIEIATAVDNAMQHDPNLHDDDVLSQGLAGYLQPSLRS